MQDLGQAEWGNIWSVILGGVIFNASNILLSASTSIAGLSVAFPLGVGLSLVLGVIINYIGAPKGDPVILFIGVALIVVAKAMDLNDFAHPAEGMLTPYSAIFIFSIGVVLSNFIFNTFVMRHPFVGEPVAYKEYFAGSLKTHLVGVLGGCDLVSRNSFQLHRIGESGCCRVLCIGTGCSDDCCHLGRIRVERVQRGFQKCLWTACRHVPVLRRRPGMYYHFRGQLVKYIIYVSVFFLI